MTSSKTRDRLSMTGQLLGWGGLILAVAGALASGVWVLARLSPRSLALLGLPVRWAMTESTDILGVAFEPIAFAYFAFASVVAVRILRRDNWHMVEPLFWVGVPITAFFVNLIRTSFRAGHLAGLDTLVAWASVGFLVALTIARKEGAESRPVELSWSVRRIAIFTVAGILLLGSARGLLAHSPPSRGVSPDTWTTDQVMAWWLRQKAFSIRPGSGSGTPPVVEVFSDYQCPWCKNAFEARGMLVELLSTRGVQFSYQMRDYPLDSSCNANVPTVIHPAACEAAIAVRLTPTDRRNSFETWLFKNQASLTVEGVITATGEHSPMSRDEYIRRRPAADAEVQADIRAATRLGIVGTPAIFVNGVPVVNGLPPSALAAIIEFEAGTSRSFR